MILSSRHRLLVERILPWIVVAILAISTYDVFFKIPYAGFEFASGRVSGVYSTDTSRGSLLIGDRLIKVGPVTWDEFQNDNRLRLFEEVVPGQVVPLIVERDGQIKSLNWSFPGPTRREILERFNSQWWIGYVFWLAGTATLLFIRPRVTPRLLLVAFNYLTALWLAAGAGPSHWHVGNSAIVLRAAIWMCVPVYLHFHWVFPRSLLRLPVYVWIALYMVGGTLAVAEWFQIPSPNAYYWGFLTAVVGSVFLLGAHFILQPAHRRDVLLLVIGSILVLLPPLGVSIASLSGVQPPIFVQGGSLLAMPAIPGAYFYAVYRRQLRGLERRARRLVILYLITVLIGTLFISLVSILGPRLALEQSTLVIGVASILLAGIIATTSFFPFLILPALAGYSYTHTHQPGQLEFRANTLVSYYLFFTLVGAATAGLIFLTDVQLDFPGEATIIGLAAALSAGILTVVGFSSFQRFVEHRLLGMPLPPTHLLETYAAKITTSLDKFSLIHLLRDEILPTLLVRQSALMHLDEKKNAAILYTVGVSEGQLPDEADLPQLLAGSGEYPSSPTDKEEPVPFPWIRVVLPLKVGGELIGLWLLGSRDPDDLYHQSEISVLKAIANQTAIALINITHAERLHTLYQTDIERQEKERARLARGLHDEVLNQLASLAMHTDDLRTALGPPESYQLITNYLRGVISDLRPAMLAYGLQPALVELIDQLSGRTMGETKVQMDVPPTEVRYNPKVEQHVFRVVQQACENALRHAHARNIRVHGNLEPEWIHLVVEDDGAGFLTGERLDLNRLLIEGHYGLVGIYERAALIGAELRIESSPGRGTEVSVVWKSEAPGP